MSSDAELAELQQRWLETAVNAVHSSEDRQIALDTLSAAASADPNWALRAVLSLLGQLAMSACVDETATDFMEWVAAVVCVSVRCTDEAAASPKIDDPRLRARALLLSYARRLDALRQASFAADDRHPVSLSLVLQPALPEAAATLVAKTHNYAALAALLHHRQLGPILTAHRFHLIQLLIETARSEDDIARAISANLLPTPDHDKRETSAWTSSPPGRPPVEDPADNPQIAGALLDPQNEVATSALPTNALYSWYNRTLRDLEKTGVRADVLGAVGAHVAPRGPDSLVSAGQAAHGLALLCQSLSILSVLAKSHAPRAVRPTTLAELELALARDAATGRTDMVLELLRAVPSPLDSFIPSVLVPLLSQLAQRASLLASRPPTPVGPAVRATLTGVVFSLSRLARRPSSRSPVHVPGEEEAFSLLWSLLACPSLAEPLGAAFPQIILACAYSTPRADAPALEMMIHALEQQQNVLSPSPEQIYTALQSHLIPQLSNDSNDLPDAQKLSYLLPPAPSEKASLSPTALTALRGHLAVLQVVQRWDASPAPIGWYLATSDRQAKFHRLYSLITGPFARSEEAQEHAWRTLFGALLLSLPAEDEDPWGQDKPAEPAQEAHLFAPLTRTEVYELVLWGLLRSGGLILFGSLIASPSPDWPSLVPAQTEAVVLAAARSTYVEANSTNMLSADMKLAREILDVHPATAALTEEKVFIEAMSKLGAYRVPSREHAGNLLPGEIRTVAEQPTGEGPFVAGCVELIGRVMANQEDAYKASDALVSLAVQLNRAPQAAPKEPQPVHDALSLIETSSPGSGYERKLSKPLVEVHVLAMLAEAAMAAGDWTRASELVERVLKVVHRLQDRVRSAQARAPNAPVSEGSATAMLPIAQEVAWKVTYQLGKQSAWDQSGRQLGLLAQALSLCPRDQVGTLLRAWRTVWEQATASLPLVTRGSVLFAPATDEAPADEGLLANLGVPGIVGEYASAAAAATPLAALLNGAGKLSPAITGSSAATPPTPAELAPEEDAWGLDETSVQDHAERGAGLLRGLSVPLRPPRPGGLRETASGLGGRVGQQLFALSEKGGHDAARAARYLFRGQGQVQARDPKQAQQQDHDANHDHLATGAEEPKSTEGRIPFHVPRGGFSLTRGVGWLLGEELDQQQQQQQQPGGDPHDPPSL